MMKQKEKLRIKEQRLLQCPSGITKSDCEEFVRIIKRYCDSFNKNDLITYCKNNKIPLNVETLSCMFDEISLNRKNKLNEINSVDLFYLITTKKKRSFYIPIVFFIGKPKYLHSYEKKLKRDQEIEAKCKRREREKIEKQIEKDRKLKGEITRYASYDEAYNMNKVCNDTLNTDVERNSITINSNSTINNDIEKDKQNELPKNDEGQIIGRKNEVEVDEETEKEKTEGKEDKGKNIKGLSTPNEKTEETKKKKEEEFFFDTKTCKKKSIISDENKEKVTKEKEKEKEKDKKKSKKSLNNRSNRKDKNGEKLEKREGLDEGQQQNESFDLEKKKKYEFLLHRVLKSQPRIKKKKKFLKSFHLVAYFKLSELIYSSFLINTFYDYFYNKELDELTEAYECVLKQYKKEEKEKEKEIEENSRIEEKGGERGERGESIEDDKKKNKNNEKKSEKINLSDVIKRYEAEREKIKKNIYSNSVNTYINSDVLTNFDFIKENINNIISTILNNLNIFFNRNINDIEEMVKQYDLFVNDIRTCSKVQKDNGDHPFEEEKEERVENIEEVKEMCSNDKKKHINEIEIDRGEDKNKHKNKQKNKDQNQNQNQNQYNNDKRNILRILKKKPKDPLDKQMKRYSSCINIIINKNPVKRNSLKNSVTNFQKKPEVPLLAAPLETSVETCVINSFTSSTFKERDVESDKDISYLERKYSKEEIQKLQNKNIAFELTNDINKIKIYKKTYFYDFFFLYVLRKLFWNIFALYSLYLDETCPKENETTEKVDSAENENLILYESDISVNNLKKDKSMLYNTNELLSPNLTTLFQLIKSEKLLIYLRYDKNKKIKKKNKTEYIYRDIWIYLILTVLYKNRKKRTLNFTFNEFIFFKETPVETFS